MTNSTFNEQLKHMNVTLNNINTNVFNIGNFVQSAFYQTNYNQQYLSQQISNIEQQLQNVSQE